MAIEDLHKYFKSKYKKKVHRLTTYPASFVSDHEKKEIYIDEGTVQIIIQQEKSPFVDYYDFWIQNHEEGEGCTISPAMKESKVIKLVDLIMEK